MSSDSKVVRVDPQGALFAVGNGTAEIVVASKAARTAPAVPCSGHGERRVRATDRPLHARHRADHQQGRLQHGGLPRVAVWQGGIQALGLRIRPESGLPGHRPRPLAAAGQLPRARTEPAAEEADAAGSARRRPTNEARLDRVRDVRRLDRLGSSGTQRLRCASDPNRRNARPQDLDTQGAAATARRRVLQRRHAAATSPRSPSSTRWTRAC